MSDTTSETTYEPKKVRYTRTGRKAKNKETNTFKGLVNPRYHVTPAEYAIIQKRAEEAGLSLMEYSRRRLLGHPIYSAEAFHVVGLLQAIHARLWGIKTGTSEEKMVTRGIISEVESVVKEARIFLVSYKSVGRNWKMIITMKPKLRNKTKRTARGHIIALIDYIMKDEGRTGDIWTSRNINTTDRIEIKGAFMATVSLNSRVRNPIRHVVISWRPEEQVSYAERAEILERLINAIGASEHQWVAVEHRDTEGLHLHLAISSVHPETFQANSFSFSAIKLMKEKALIEHERGWDKLPYPEFENAPFRANEEGAVEDRRGKRGQAFARAGALSKERYHSGMSMESYLNATFVSILGKNHNGVKGWKAEELHEILGSMGLEIKRQGGGAILVWHHLSESGDVIQERRKLSAVEGWKFAKLQKVLDGGFQEAQKKYVQPVGFQHSPTNPKTQDQSQKDIQEVKAQIKPTQTKLKKRHLYQEVIKYNNTPAAMAATHTDAVLISQKKLTQAKQKAEQKKKIEADRKARAEFLRQQAERFHQQEEEARQFLERVRREQELEKASASPSALSVHTESASIETTSVQPDQDQSQPVLAGEVSTGAEDYGDKVVPMSRTKKR